MKDEGLNPQVSWSVICREKEYTRESKSCNLCTREKLEILKHSLDPNSLNKRAKILNKCIHRNKFLLGNVNTRGFKGTAKVPQNQGPCQNEIFDPGDSVEQNLRLPDEQTAQDRIYERGKTRSGIVFNAQNPT